MTDERYLQIQGILTKAKRELMKIVKEDEFEVAACILIDRWCAENGKNPVDVSLKIHEAIHECKG